MIDPLRQAMLDVWESLYDVQVLVAPLNPALLDDIGDRLATLSYRVHLAKQRARPYIKPIRNHDQPLKESDTCR